MCNGIIAPMQRAFDFFILFFFRRLAQERA